MWTHPQSIGLNHKDLFPELFDSYDWSQFLASLSIEGSANDYLTSADFLYGSKPNSDLSVLFSAVQRLYGEDHVTFGQFLKQDSHLEEIVGISSKSSLKTKLSSLEDEYNNRHGMGRLIKSFYREYLSDEDKEQLRGKFPLPANYKISKAGDVDAQIDLRLDELLAMRGKYSHSATFGALSKGEYPEFIEVAGKTVPITLTFDDFYEMTRKAMVKFWSEKYEECSKNSCEEKSSQLLEEIGQQVDAFNKNKGR
jgi:hypothetical protein